MEKLGNFEIVERFSQRCGVPEIVTHGSSNLVAIYPEIGVVLRLARHPEAAIAQRFEIALLSALRDADDSMLEIPAVIESSLEPAYMVYHYIPGSPHFESRVRLWGEWEQAAVGRVAARFIHWMGATISEGAFNQLPGAKERLRRQQAADEAELMRLCNFADERFPTLSRQSTSVVEQIAARYPGYPYSGAGTGRIIHDDFHMGNVLFDESHTMRSVIDFAKARSSVLERELRQIFSVGDAVLEPCVSELKRLEGITICRQDVLLWAGMKHMAGTCERIVEGRLDSGYLQDARRKMERWYPEQDWSELESCPASPRV
jgi:aminoglycoside phosphotransferase (APT) family kinase protein